MHVTALLLIVLVGLLLGLLAAGFLYSRRQQASGSLAWAGDDLFILGLLTFAAFGLGVFIAVILLGPRG